MSHLQRAVDGIFFVVYVNAANAEDDGDGIGCHEGLGVHFFSCCGRGGGQKEALLLVDLLAHSQRFDCGEVLQSCAEKSARAPYPLRQGVRSRPEARRNFARSSCRIDCGRFMWCKTCGKKAGKRRRWRGRWVRGAAPLFLKLAPFAADLAKMINVTASIVKSGKPRRLKTAPQVIVEQALDFWSDTAVAVGRRMSIHTTTGKISRKVPDAPDSRAIVSEEALGFAGDPAKLVHLCPGAERAHQGGGGGDGKQKL